MKQDKSSDSCVQQDKGFRQLFSSGQKFKQCDLQDRDLDSCVFKRTKVKTSMGSAGQMLKQLCSSGQSSDGCVQQDRGLDSCGFKRTEI